VVQLSRASSADHIVALTAASAVCGFSWEKKVPDTFHAFCECSNTHHSTPKTKRSSMLPWAAFSGAARLRGVVSSRMRRTEVRPICSRRAISAFGGAVIRPSSNAALTRPKTIVSGQAERILLQRNSRGRTTCASLEQGLAMVPRHPEEDHCACEAVAACSVPAAQKGCAQRTHVPVLRDDSGGHATTLGSADGMRQNSFWFE
jgi:hypothetical protein